MKNKNIKMTKFIFIFAIFLLLLIGSFLFLEFQKAKKVNEEIKWNPLEVKSEIKANGLVNGLVLNKYSPKIFKLLTSDKCFIEFENTWFGTLEINIPPHYKHEKIKFKLGERAKDNRVIDPMKDGQDFVAYFESTVYVRDLNAQTIRIDIPERNLPGKNKLPFGLSGVLPFKYVEVSEGCDVSLKGNVNQLGLMYKFDDKNSGFSSSNKVLDEVYAFSKHTIKATSFTGLYIDGYRELKPYEADAYINQLGHYAIDSDYEMARATQQYLLENGTWPTEWAPHSVFMAFEDYMRTGDKDFLIENYSKLRARSLIDLLGEDFLVSSSRQSPELLREAGIIESPMVDIIDWPRSEHDSYPRIPIESKAYYKGKLKVMLKKIRLSFIRLLGFPEAEKLYSLDIYNEENKLYKAPSKNLVVNAFYYDAVKKMSFLAREIGNKEDSKLFSDYAAKSKKAIQDTFFDDKKGLFVDAVGFNNYSKQTNVFALKFGLVPKESVSKVVKFIINNKTGSVYLYQYVLEALYEHGASKAAFDIMTSKGERSWYHMIHVLNSGMATESWDFNVKPDMDMNHAWATAPVNIIPRYLAGIKPTKPRYKEFDIYPMDDELENYSLLLPTLDGNIAFNKKTSELNTSYHLEFTGDKLANLQIKKPKCDNVIASINGGSIDSGKSERIIVSNLPSGRYDIHMICGKMTLPENDTLR